MTNSPHWPRAFQDSVHLIIAHFDKIWLPTICSTNFVMKTTPIPQHQTRQPWQPRKGAQTPAVANRPFLLLLEFFRRRSLSNIRAGDHNSLARIKSRLVLVKKMRREHAFEEMKVSIRKGEIHAAAETCLQKHQAGCLCRETEKKHKNLRTAIWAQFYMSLAFHHLVRFWWYRECSLAKILTL